MTDANDSLPAAQPNPPPPAGPSAGDTDPHLRAARPPAAPPPVRIGGNVGGDVVGGDLHKEQTAGRDIVGRDVVTNTSTTNVGFSVEAVQRLVLVVGLLVAATAACFFAIGGVTAAAVVLAFNRPVNSNNQAVAASFAANLANVRALAPGQSYEFSFTEEEISSYFHTTLEPLLQGEVSGGQVRLLDSGQVAVMGRSERLGGLRFAATFAWQKNTPGAPLRLTGVLLQVVPLGDSPLGWVGVPSAPLKPFETQLNSLFGRALLQDVHPLPQPHTWDVTVVGQ
jgi:hypothetical protein